MPALRYDFVGTLANCVTLPDGSLCIPARIARTGVQVYTYADGTIVREYRPPEEVFSQDTLQSFDDVSVTDGHPAEPVNPTNWSRLAKGHVDDPHEDDTFIAADVIVKDAGIIARIASGELVELSAGYYVQVDPTPGVSPEGEVYDAIQRTIIGNHVALGPVGWGRAGGDVRLYTDSKNNPDSGGLAVCYHSDESEMNMPPAIATTEKRNDAPGTPATPEVMVPVAVYDRAVAERDIALAKVKELEGARVDGGAQIGASVARRVLACTIEPSVSKLATDSKVSDRAVMEAVITSKRKISCDGKNDAYVEACFDMIVADHEKDTKQRTDAREHNTQAIGGIVKAAVSGTMQEDSEKDPVEIARNAARDRDRKRFDQRYATKGKGN